MKKREFELDEQTVKALLQLALFGHTLAESAKFFGISESTLKRRLHEEEEIAAKEGTESVLTALKNARELPDAQVTESLFRRATGFKIGKNFYPPDTTAAIFWLKNRRPDKWRDVQRNEMAVEVEKAPPPLKIVIEKDRKGKTNNEDRD